MCGSAITRLDDFPRVEPLAAETGLDMSVFPTPGQDVVGRLLPLRNR
jgi:hypothetical protein